MTKRILNRNVAAIIVLVIFTLFLICCGIPERTKTSMPIPTPEPAMAPSSPALSPTPNYAIVNVFFATNRNRIEPSQSNVSFGCERSTICYGACQVSIPRHHQIGELESPSIWRLEFRDDPEIHVVLLRATLQEKTSYFTELAACVQKSPAKSAFIFVHGYNVSFEDAARRTAQMTYDLNFDGAPVFYSWPSQGEWTDYFVDEGNAEWAESDFCRFLEDFTEKTQAENIYLIAHSMGNRVLTGSLVSVLAKKPELRKRFREVILAAPDIDADVFKRDIAPKVIGDNQFVTLYVSSRDKALRASKKIKHYARVGDLDGGVVVLPGVETIDATMVDTDFLGHSYALESRALLADMFYLIHDGKRPQQRFSLKPIKDTQGEYWAFKD